MNYETYLGDCLEVLKKIPDESVDSLITDPPAGIGLGGLDWDSDRGGRDTWVAWMAQVMAECLRVLKPGAHGFVWAIPRTSHWTATALENAGFEIKDVVTHIFGSGFPKSSAIDKALDRVKYTDTDLLIRVAAWIRARRDELGLTNKELDKIAGVKGGACHWAAAPDGQPNIPTKERWDLLTPVLGPAPQWLTDAIRPSYKSPGGGLKQVEKVSRAEGDQWNGWGTALKPASENWILIQKPIAEHNIAANVKKFGTGGLNIDACRIPVVGKIPSTSNLDFRGGGFLWETSERSKRSVYNQHPAGRFPANLLITQSDANDCPTLLMNEQSDGYSDVSQYFKNLKPEAPFFYCKKSGSKERGDGNSHPTVKPLALMRYLSLMITPPKGKILDPFMGSGSTGVAAISLGFHFVGIEREEIYYQIASKRLKEIEYD